MEKHGVVEEGITPHVSEKPDKEKQSSEKPDLADHAATRLAAAAEKKPATK